MPELALKSPVASRYSSYVPPPAPEPESSAILKREIATLRAELRGEKAERMALERSMGRIWDKMRLVDAQFAEAKRLQKTPNKPRTVSDVWRERRCWICGVRGRCQHREYDVDLAIIEADARKKQAVA